MSDTNIVIFGAGENGRNALARLPGNQACIAFCDNNPSLQNTIAYSRPVISPDELGHWAFDRILVSSQQRKPIVDQLNGLGYGSEMIDFFEPREGDQPGFAQLPNRGGAFNRMKEIGIAFESVIDVGASNGCWTDVAMKFFPKARYLLIDAQAVHEPALRKYCENHDNCAFLMAVVGQSKGELYFNGQDPFGGVASEEPREGYDYKLASVSLDEAASDSRLEGPYLIKMDTHGFEKPIIEGAGKVLENTAALIIECNMYRLTPGCPTFYELCDYLNGKGFRPFDIFDLQYHGEGHLNQMDIVFIRSDHPQFRCDVD